MARATMEHALATESVDLLFNEREERQYTRALLFSSIVDLMGLTVSKVQPSIHDAFQSVKGTLPVSITAVYDKLNSVEPGITSALVRHTAQRLAPVIVSTGGKMPCLLPGYRVRIIDGNHLAATERRLEALRGSVAGPLPGHSLVVLDPELMLATHMIPCEDGHAQERSLTDQVLSLVEFRDVWVADRNFCTGALLQGVNNRSGRFVIREHKNLPVQPVTPLSHQGSTDTGEVFEQMVTVGCPDGTLLEARRVILKLVTPTRDGDNEMAILSNLPSAEVDAVTVANLYRKRWKLETDFQVLSQILGGGD
jgi:IS4 transposase